MYAIGKSFVSLLILCGAPGAARAWGGHGHRTVTAIAMSLIPEKAARMVTRLCLLLFVMSISNVQFVAAQDVGPIISELTADTPKVVRPSGANIAFVHLSFNYRATGTPIGTLFVTSAAPDGSTQSGESHAVERFGIVGSTGTGHYQLAFRANMLPGSYDYQLQLVDAKNQKSQPVSVTIDMTESGSADLQISSVEPASGRPADKIVLRGTGLSAKDTTVTLGTVSAKLIEATEDSLVFLVPGGAMSGPITVVNQKGVAVSPSIFTVPNTTQVVGAGQKTVFAGQAVQFATMVDGKVDRSTAWSVNGQVGGSARYGTIDKFGNYVAPTTVPDGRSIEISAASDTTKVSGKANIIIAPPHPMRTTDLIAASVGGSVRDARGLLTLEIPPAGLAQDTKLIALSSQPRPSRENLKGIPEGSFPVIQFQSIADRPSALKEPIRFRLLLPAALLAGSKHRIMVRPNKAVVFQDAGAALVENDGLTLSGQLSVKDPNFVAVILQSPSLGPPLPAQTLEAQQLSAPPDTRIEEGMTLPVHVVGRGFVPGLTFVSAGSASSSCSTPNLDLGGFPLDQLLDFGPVLVSPDGTQLGFTLRIHPMYLLQLNQQLCFSFRLDRVDAVGAVVSSVTTRPEWFVVNGLPELIVCESADAASHCPAPESDLFTVEGIRVHRALADAAPRFSEMRIDAGATLAIGTPISTIQADVAALDLSSIGALIDKFGHLTFDDGSDWNPSNSAHILQPANHAVKIDVTGPVNIAGTVYLRGMHGGENPHFVDPAGTGRLGGFESGVLSGGIGGRGGMSSGNQTADGHSAGEGTDAAKGRGAGGLLDSSQTIAGGGSRYDQSVFSLDGWFQAAVFLAALDYPLFAALGGIPSDAAFSSFVGPALTTNNAVSIGGAIIPVLAQAIASQVSSPGAPAYTSHAGKGGGGGHRPSGVSAILDEDAPFQLVPGGGGAGGGGGGSTFEEVALFNIPVHGDAKSGGGGGGGGGAAGALRIISSREFEISTSGAIDARGGRGGRGEPNWALGGPGGGGGGGAGGILKLQSPQFFNRGNIDASGGALAGAPVQFNQMPVPHSAAGHVQILDGPAEGGNMVYYGSRWIGIHPPSASLLWSTGRFRAEVALPFTGIRAVGKGLSFIDLISGNVDPTAPGPAPLRALLVITNDMRVEQTTAPEFSANNPQIIPIGELIDLHAVPALAGFAPSSVTQSPFPPFNIFVGGVHGTGAENLARSQIHMFDRSGNYIGMVFNQMTEFASAGAAGHLQDIDFLSDGRLLGLMTLWNNGSPTDGIHRIDIGTGAASYLWRARAGARQAAAMSSMSVHRAVNGDAVSVVVWDPIIGEDHTSIPPYLEHYDSSGNTLPPWALIVETISSPGDPGLVRVDGAFEGSNEPRVTYGGVTLADTIFRDNPAVFHAPAISSLSARRNDVATGLESLVFGQDTLPVFCQGAEPGAANVELWRQQSGGTAMGVSLPRADDQGNCGGTLMLPDGFTSVWVRTADGGQPSDLLKRRVLFIPQGSSTPQPAHLTINEVVVPAADPDLFNIQLDGVPYVDLRSGGTTGPQAVRIGRHTLSETGVGPTRIENYTITIGGNCATDGSIILNPGDSKTCTVTSARISRQECVARCASERDDCEQSGDVPGGIAACRKQYQTCVSRCP